MPTVLITGAARGLGAEFVSQYRRDGWSVLACARNSSRIVEDEQVTGWELDLTSEDSMEELSRQLSGVAIDVLVNCAGTMGDKTFGEAGLKAGVFGDSRWTEWRDIFKLNVFAPMRLTELLVNNVAASEQKKVVTLTSILGSIGKNKIGGLYAYRASKAAVNAIMRSMSIDLFKNHGILALAMHPGWVQTDMGGEQADINAVQSVEGLRRVIAELTSDQLDSVLMYDGSRLPW